MLNRTRRFPGRACVVGKRKPSPVPTVRTNCITPPVGQELSVSAQADGYARNRFRTMLREPRATRLDITLTPATALRVQVVDRHSLRPIEGAEVQLARPEHTMTTDTDGEFALTQAAPGTRVYVIVTADGYCSFKWISELSAEDFDRPLRIPLIGLAWIEGVVTDKHGEPVENARVRSKNEEVSQRGRVLNEEEKKLFKLSGRFEIPRDSLTDEAGHFRLGVLPSKVPHFVHASHENYGDRTVGPAFLESAGQNHWVEISFGARTTIRGRVVFNGTPLVKENVFCRNEAAGDTERSTTNEQGEYEIQTAPGEIRVFFRHNKSLPGLREALLTVEAGQEYRQDFIWDQEMAPITGRVIDTSGEPLPAILVMAFDHVSPQDMLSFAARTAADGTYSLDVATGARYDVSVRTRGPARRCRTEVPAGASDVDFVIPTSGTLRVQLIDQETMKPVVPQGSGLRSITWREGGTDVFSAIRAPADVDGIVELELPVGLVDLVFRLNEDGYGRKMVPGLIVEEKANPAPVPILLSRGVDVALSFRGPGDLAKQIQGRLLFLLEQSEESQLRGPFPLQGGPSNHRINGVCMWIGDHGLLQQLVYPKNNRATLQGLAPGEYILRSYPDDLVFDPPRIHVSSAGTVNATITWSLR